MDVLATTEAATQLILQIATLATQAYQAHAAGDQATLDAIHAQIVAASNAAAPPGGIAPVVVS